MTERDWQRLEGIDPAQGDFPARARLGDEGILIFRAGAGYRGVQRQCPHQRAPLTDAVIAGNGTMIRCTRHNYMFRLSDGKGVNCPGFKIAVYEVKEEGGALFARPLATAATA